MNLCPEFKVYELVILWPRDQAYTSVFFHYVIPPLLQYSVSPVSAQKISTTVKYQ